MPPLTPIKSFGAKPFAMTTIDFIMDLPLSNEKNSLLVVVNHGLTKGIVLISCTKAFGALNTADALLNNVYRRLGLLDIIISDRSTQFIS
jgi:hypothetical protein